jgi:hypothetical protein
MTGFTADFVAGVPSWGAKVAYGPTTLVGGVEVLPVALVAFGFGAGELNRAAADGPSSEGGGGSGVSLPIGVYIGEAGAARFVPNTLAVAVALTSGIAAVGVAVSSILLVARGTRVRVAR